MSRHPTPATVRAREILAARTVLVGTLIGIDVPGGKRFFPRE